MRSALGLLAGCGFLMLLACSRTDSPEFGGSVAAIPLAEAADTSLPAEKSPGEAAGSEPVREGNTGLAVGQKAPSFGLMDQAGTKRSLDEFLTEGKVALVFYRSANW